jgi:hypothetical protein
LRSFGNIENAAWKQFLWLCGMRANWKRTWKDCKPQSNNGMYSFFFCG